MMYNLLRKIKYTPVDSGLQLNKKAHHTIQIIRETINRCRCLKMSRIDNLSSWPSGTGSFDCCSWFKFVLLHTSLSISGPESLKSVEVSRVKSSIFGLHVSFETMISVSFLFIISSRSARAFEASFLFHFAARWTQPRASSYFPFAINQRGDSWRILEYALIFHSWIFMEFL